MNFLYIHGYKSNSNAVKCNQLRQMFPQHSVFAPTIVYDTTAPNCVQQTIRELVDRHSVDVIVGSSLGGYHALCATQWFEGLVWVINPPHDIASTLMSVTENITDPSLSDQALRMMDLYLDFDHRMFRQLPQRQGQINLALSLDDEVIGDHRPLLSLFRKTGIVILRGGAGHRFSCFPDIKHLIEQSAETLGIL